MTSAGFSAYICADENHSGFTIWSASRIHVDAFWSNIDQNGVTGAAEP